VTLIVAGQTHTVGVLTCRGPGEGSSAQVLAYRRDGDAFVLVGPVFDTSMVAPAEGAWAFVTGIAVAGESVVVDVMVRLSIGSSVPRFEEMTQQRTFTWDGTGYTQTAGPTSFLADPATVDLSLTTGSLAFAPAEGVCRTGTITLTITNRGASSVDGVAVALILPGLGERPVDCPAPPGQGLDSAMVEVGAIGPGQSRTVTATVVADSRGDPGRFGGPPDRTYADLRVGDQRTGDKVQLAIEY
jgi:hypothetical protein